MFNAGIYAVFILDEKYAHGPGIGLRDEVMVKKSGQAFRSSMTDVIP
jgi:hypothetical protein